jgi:hypothetical protein
LETEIMPGFAGFDRSDYPGDAVMTWLLANTNLLWCGYYLAPAPSHPDQSWMTRRAALADAGWGIAPIYVGRQVTGPGTPSPDGTNGATDGADAVQLMTNEGFAPGAAVYLDLENGPPINDAQAAYIAAWCDAVAGGNFLPGVYCSHLLALNVHLLRSETVIWAFNVNTTQSHPVPAPYPDPSPAGCGYIGATAWQLGQNCVIKCAAAHLGSLVVDLSSASVADPGMPQPAASQLVA